MGTKLVLLTEAGGIVVLNRRAPFSHQHPTAGLGLDWLRILFCLTDADYLARYSYAPT